MRKGEREDKGKERGRIESGWRDRKGGAKKEKDRERVGRLRK